MIPSLPPKTIKEVLPFCGTGVVQEVAPKIPPQVIKEVAPSLPPQTIKEVLPSLPPEVAQEVMPTLPPEVAQEVVPLGRSVRPPRIGTPRPSIPLGPSDKPERGNKGSPPDLLSLYNAVMPAQGTPEPIREVRPPRIGTPPFDPNLGQPPLRRQPKFPGQGPVRIPEPVGPPPMEPPFAVGSRFI